MNEIIPFSFEGAEIRTVYRNDLPWFVAMDVCKALGIANSRDAIARLIQKLDNDEKMLIALQQLSTVPTSNTAERANADPKQSKLTAYAVNWFGLDLLLVRSRKPVAKHFRKWAWATFWPSIRKTGTYYPALPTSSTQSNDQQELIEALRDKIALLEENRSLVKDRKASSTFVGIARQLFEKTDFSDDTIAEILAPGIGTRMPEWVTWQRRQHH
ncbi:BRO-N domain-containing protein [Thalassospira mesophila]|uniref:BRO-N domain-containing protein n=1 Tax=Thalassospira mesophila TaxID=1293891 RepID=UPI000A1DAED8|nr:BRO family protein [Thalassospira mesophila]